MSGAVLVDSCVILDVIAGSTEWAEWSARMLQEVAASGEICVNPIIFAEVSIGFAEVQDVAEALDTLDFHYADLPWDAAFLAGKAFLRYRREGGERRSPLPDFYIGAHALVAGMTLLTRDARRYRRYFPRLALLTPE